MKTKENAYQYEHSLDHNVEFFSKAGSIFDNKRDPFYGTDSASNILTLFQSSWITDKLLTFKLLLWLRDCRGGAGNRSGFRKCLSWLAKRQQDHMWVTLNLKSIIEHGRYDDLRCLFGTFVEKDAVYVWNEALIEKDFLAAKWAKRTDIPLYLDLKATSFVKNIGDFRRMLSKIRSGVLVESKMCSGKWSDINYEHVPSVAMARYTGAFNKNDSDRFTSFKESLSTGEKKVNASVLFPHDCVRTCKNGDNTIADAQFNALPDYIDGEDSIMVLADTSGSMDSPASGSVTCDDVSRGLALYCSSRAKGPFHKKFIQFESESTLTDWTEMSFSDAVSDNTIFNGAVGSTRIDKALDMLLSIATTFNVSDKDMPKMLLICSDMQFSQGCRCNKGLYGSFETVTEVERSLRKWDQANYSRPKIVYWNLSPYSGQPDTVDSKDIALISGFSPSILKSVLSCDDLSPRAVMLAALEKYVINIPEN